MKKYIYITFAVIFIGFALVNITSCKKYADNPPYFQPYDSSAIPTDRRVLIIAIDGLQSDAFKTAATPNYTALMEHGKYTWDAKADIISTDAAAWKTLTAGVTYSSHHIADSSFQVSDIDYSGGDFEGGLNQPPNYPSFFYFIMRSKMYNAPTAILSSWGNMVNSVANEARLKGVLNNDAAVRDSAVKLVKDNDPKVLVVNFNGPAKLVSDPASTATFSASSADYMNSLKTVDGYIGDIMTALQNRPGYNNTEEWLVMITGTHGGINKTYGGTTDAETLVPTLYYYKTFKKQEFTSVGSYSSVKLQSNTITASLDDPTDEYMPKTGQMTIQFKIKGSMPAYGHFISKWNGAWSGGTGGWSIFGNGSGWGFSLKSGSSGERRIQGSVADKNISDGSWHTLTFVFYDSASKRFVKRFTDDARIPDTNGDITSILGNGASIVSQGAPFTIAVSKDSYGGDDFSIADIKVFKTALTDAEIVTSICADYKAVQNNNLTAYWPCDDGVGNFFTNKLNGSKNFTLSGVYKWVLDANYPCSFIPNPPTGKSTLFLKNIDIPAQVFYWLGLTVPTSWALEGNIWLTPFESEFIKI